MTGAIANEPHWGEHNAFRGPACPALGVATIRCTVVHAREERTPMISKAPHQSPRQAARSVRARRGRRLAHLTDADTLYQERTDEHL
jgi:hypothetical protein